MFELSKLKIFAALPLIVAACAAPVYCDGAPAWLQQAASIKHAPFDKEVNAVVLLRDQSVTLDESGRLTTVERYAVRVLTREGRSEAAGVAFYLSNFSQIRDMQGWHIAPAGTVTSYGKKDIIDRISDPDDVYNEGRLKVIDATGGAEVGSVFGYTVTTEDKPLFYQDKWLFQDDLPTLVSRYTLTLPSGWTANSITFNHAEITPQKNGNTYVWELRDLGPIVREPMSPSFSNIAPRIAINYFPADGAQAGNRAFTDWTDVTRWATSLYEPQVIIDDALAAKTRELVGEPRSELDTIRAVGRFVQNLQYISIDIGVGYGNGMKPRPSNLVLNRGYGDCKDKANLMRAMLKVMRIDAYPVAIYSGDPSFVRKEWASPGQFNHAIIAIKISDATGAAAVIDHPKLGRLLIFDATDQFTPVGDLPDDLQGSNGLLIAGENGGLIQMPVTPPDFNAWNRETEVSLDANGGIRGVIRERTSGQEARLARSMFRTLPASEFSKVIEAWLTRGATAAKLIKLSPEDKQADSAFNMDVEFSAPAYGQLMQDRLMVFKPAVASRTNSVYLTEKSRKHPIRIESNSFNERVTFNLPGGFTVDETPDAVKIQAPFGSYSTTYEVKDGKLFFTRSLTMTRSTVAVERYGEIRDFFSKMRDAEQAPVVLIKK
jgi:hypothetical protein